ncbi:alpha-N-acetylglucosaminidase TIM-barrel domain-containing protein [Streptomyces sp. NPDC048603]|uniref:alpha-N-acetylglucosaminidase n=1 Tax=Streptomyces sp. NPDC048603 TaxID=3365577 RepID=UPI00371078C6
MDVLSRRALLGGAGAVGLSAGLPALAPAATALPATALPAPAAEPAAPRPATPPAATPAAAYEALYRLLPRHAAQFVLRLESAAAAGRDRFEVTGTDGRIEVTGTGPAVLLTGVHWYLKYVCRTHLSPSGGRPDLPAVLPAPGRPLERSATVPNRFALNDTHDGYTGPYADWAHWERLIDDLALHGCNQVLVTVGQEAVHHRLLLDCGYTDAEARAWLPAPSHQPWWLLQNLSGYGGPLSAGIIARRAELGRRITDRLRAYGMRPVLPGWFGAVPDGFTDRHPTARVVPQGTWCGMRRPDWLDPRTPPFAEAAAAFYRHQRELLGDADHFKMDLLHEGGTPGDVPVADAARAVERALQTAHPGATWVLLGWQHNPLPALLDAVDRSRLLIVDGLSDLDTVTDRERDWAGTPYAFGTIPNFGGRTTIGANTDRWTAKFPAWRDKPDSACTGTAYMPEATGRDAAAFELFGELAWREETIDRAAWFARYADFRYGAPDPAARTAFAGLAATAYRLTSRDGRPHDSLFTRRPRLHSSSATAFDQAGFDRAFAALLDVAPALRASDAYRHDLTDLARQALANRSRTLHQVLRTAWLSGDAATFRPVAALWLKLMRMADTMAGCHRDFLLGPWLEAAKRFATDPAEAAGLERTARALITTWADRPAATTLNNYAGRDWHGLIAGLHLPQWEEYLREHAEALEGDRAPAAFDFYPREEAWTEDRGRHPVRPTGDPHRTARTVHDTLADAPYQGFTTLTLEPRTLPPGGTATLTAAFRNHNGLRATGPVDLALDGPEGIAAVTPLGRPPAGEVAPGGTVRASWRVSAPLGPPAQPLQPLPYALRVTVRHGPEGRDPVTVTQRGSLLMAAPLDPGWRTRTSNSAVFGQTGDRFAISGAGDDLWRHLEQFGTAYRPAALTAGVSIRLRVDAQDPTAGWARAGIVVRNRLDRPGSAGFVNLATTPAQGVVLSWDSTGDGTLDALRRITGLAAPALLRLTRRSRTEFTAECSADGGSTWQTVAGVSVPGAAAAQDAGLFMTAAGAGTGARGTARFSGWALGPA